MIKLIKSRKRIREFAEVYTPEWLVKDMIALTNAAEPYTIVLEPSCGNGNFLAEILEQKLAKCNSEDEAWDSLKTLYGVDILIDNIEECKERLCKIFINRVPGASKIEVIKILERNVVCGNFLTKRYCNTNELIWFLDDG